MIQIIIFAITALSIGLVIGRVLKPLKPKMFPNEHMVVYYLLWALFWPAILVHFVWVGLRKTWRSMG